MAETQLALRSLLRLRPDLQGVHAEVDGCAASGFARHSGLHHITWNRHSHSGPAHPGHLLLDLANGTAQGVQSRPERPAAPGEDGGKAKTGQSRHRKWQQCRNLKRQPQVEGNPRKRHHILKRKLT